MSLHILKSGELVTVSHPIRGKVTAQVIGIARPEELPTIEEAPPIRLVRQYLDELGIVQIATITYVIDKQSVAFVAIGDGRGNWWDLQRQNLEIRRARPHDKLFNWKHITRPL